METWDDWDDFLKVIASDHDLTVDQEAVFLVRLSRQSIDSKRTNQDIANEVIGGEPDKALYAYNKRMKEVFDKLSQSFPEINSESRGKVERTQACLEKAYLEQQNKKKHEAASHAIASPTSPNWREVCHGMLETALAQSVPKLRQGMTYSEARNLLIEEGWQAVFNTSQVNNPNRGAVIDRFIEKGYTEVVDCSGTGLGLCLFQFQNATGQSLFVTTANNYSEEESIVFGWRLE
jgi:hypothetical protein